MSSPAIRIQFDKSMELIDIFLEAETNDEEKRLREIADRVKATIREESSDKKTVSNAIEQMQAQQDAKFCILCGGCPAVVGVFVPDKPVLHGAKKKKRRFIRYYLCERCHSDPESPEKAEKVIRVELQGGGM